MAVSLTFTILCLSIISTVDLYNLTYIIPDDDVRTLTLDFMDMCPAIPLCKIDNHVQSVRSPLNAAETCCSLCSCWENCNEMKDCCPDMFNDILRIKNVEPTTTKCVNLVYGSNDYLENGYLVLADCPHVDNQQQPNNRYSNDLLARKCTQHYTHYDFEDGLAGLLPVIDLDTGLTFKNIYCLRCNGIPEENLYYFGLVENCIYDNIVLATTLNSIFTDRLDMCTPMFELVYSQSVRNIAPEQCKVFLIDTCNSTGTQNVIDARLEMYCHAYTSKYREYKNVHCALCNGVPREDIRNGKCDKINNGLMERSQINTRVLLEVEATNEFKDIADELMVQPVFENCTQAKDLNESHSKKYPCVARHCPKHYILYRMLCVSLYTWATWFPVQLHFRFYPIGKVAFDNPIITSLQNTVQKELNTTAKEIDIYVLLKRVAVDILIKIDEVVTDPNRGPRTQRMQAPNIIYIEIHAHLLYTQVKHVENFIQKLNRFYGLSFGLGNVFQKEFVGESADIIRHETDYLQKIPVQLPAKFQRIYGVSQAIEDVDGNLVFILRDDGVSATKSVYISPISTCSQIILDAMRFDRYVFGDGKIYVRVLNKSVELSEVVFSTDYFYMVMCEDLYRKVSLREDNTPLPADNGVPRQEKPTNGGLGSKHDLGTKGSIAMTRFLILMAMMARLAFESN